MVVTQHIAYDNTIRVFCFRLQKKCCQCKFNYNSLWIPCLEQGSSHTTSFYLGPLSVSHSLKSSLTILHPVFLVLFIVDRKHKEIKKMAPDQ